jgi:hypothetical protein
MLACWNRNKKEIILVVKRDEAGNTGGEESKSSLVGSLFEVLETHCETGRNELHRLAPKSKISFATYLNAPKEN